MMAQKLIYTINLATAFIFTSVILLFRFLLMENKNRII